MYLLLNLNKIYLDYSQHMPIHFYFFELVIWNNILCCSSVINIYDCCHYTNFIIYTFIPLIHCRL